jgi:hypothetical protein
MPYQFERGRIYRMPTHFGPAPGPRQIPAEANADSTRSPRKTLISASFLTEASALERHIPDRFTLVGDPVVTVEFHYMTDIDWLPGRGYTLAASFYALAARVRRQKRWMLARIAVGIPCHWSCCQCCTGLKRA